MVNGTYEQIVRHYIPKGVTVNFWNKNFGCWIPDEKVLNAPYPKTPVDAFIGLHESSHIRLGHTSGYFTTREVAINEYECNMETFRIMREEGIPITDEVMAIVQSNVGMLMLESTICNEDWDFPSEMWQLTPNDIMTEMAYKLPLIMMEYYSAIPGVFQGKINLLKDIWAKHLTTGKPWNYFIRTK